MLRRSCLRYCREQSRWGRARRLCVTSRLHGFTRNTRRPLTKDAPVRAAMLGNTRGSTVISRNIGEVAGSSVARREDAAPSPAAEGWSGGYGGGRLGRSGCSRWRSCCRCRLGGDVVVAPLAQWVELMTSAVVPCCPVRPADCVAGRHLVGLQQLPIMSLARHVVVCWLGPWPRVVTGGPLPLTR